MMKYVIASSNRQGDYDFLAPIWALVWRNITAYTPVLLLTENRNAWMTPCGNIVLDMIEQYGVRRHYIGLIHEAYRTSYQAQCARQHAAILKSFEPEDYFMLADVDMLATSGAWFDAVDWSKDVHLRYSNAWHYSHFTTPYVGAKVAVWREFMGYEAGGEIAPILQQVFDRHLTRDHDSWTGHWLDEWYYTSRLKGSRFYPDRCDFIERDGHPPKDRIDRCNWPSELGDVGRFTDAHVLRPAFSDDNWPRIRALLERLIPKHVSELDKYRNRYAEAKR